MPLDGRSAPALRDNTPLTPPLRGGPPMTSPKPYRGIPSAHFLKSWKVSHDAIKADALRYGALNLARVATELGISRQAFGQRVDRALAYELISEAELNALKNAGEQDVEIRTLVPASLAVKLADMAADRGVSRSLLVLEACLRFAEINHPPLRGDYPSHNPDDND